MSDRAPLLNNQGAALAALLSANLNSFALDFVARTAVGGTDLSYFIIKQLPVLSPEVLLEDGAARYSGPGFIVPRVVELIYTAWDLQAFGRDCGYNGPPFRWDEERRFQIRCELDAVFFHLYGIERDDVDYIMESFPIVKRKDEKAHGEYRTKRVILERYDGMARAEARGEEYVTPLDPPPGDPRAAHQGIEAPEWIVRWERELEEMMATQEPTGQEVEKGAGGKRPKGKGGTVAPLAVPARPDPLQGDIFEDTEPAQSSDESGRAQVSSHQAPDLSGIEPYDGHTAEDLYAAFDQFLAEEGDHDWSAEDMVRGASIMLGYERLGKRVRGVLEGVYGVWKKREG